jgi:hypothetical protein
MFVEETLASTTGVMTLREAREYARLIIMERSEERASFILRRSHKSKLNKVLVDFMSEWTEREKIKEYNAVMWVIMRKTNVVIDPVVLDIQLQI